MIKKFKDLTQEERKRVLEVAATEGTKLKKGNKASDVEIEFYKNGEPAIYFLGFGDYDNKLETFHSKKALEKFLDFEVEECNYNNTEAIAAKQDVGMCEVPIFYKKK